MVDLLLRISKEIHSKLFWFPAIYKKVTLHKKWCYLLRITLIDVNKTQFSSDFFTFTNAKRKPHFSAKCRGYRKITMPYLVKRKELIVTVCNVNCHWSIAPEKQLINIINAIIPIISTKSFTIFNIYKNINLKHSNYQERYLV